MLFMDLAGRYRLEKRLGQGAMGEVWRALDLRLRRPVAVKLMAPHLDSDEQVNRFLREGRLAAQISHPGVTTVFDVDLHDRHPFIVMELLDGRDLGSALKEHPSGLGLDKVFEICGQLAGALDSAHALGIVHRDLKPTNIMLVRNGMAKICDFGIARVVDGTRITKTGHSLGTPVYMAPEQFSSGNVDQRADLYSLGCILYELCTGHPPFPATTLAQAMYGHLNASPTSPESGNKELDSLILSLLAKNPGGRPKNASEITRKLREIKQNHQRKIDTWPALQNTIDAYYQKFKPLVGAESAIHWVRMRKEKEIDRQNFAEAAEYRDREKLLLQRIKKLELVASEFSMAMADIPHASEHLRHLIYRIRERKSEASDRQDFDEAASCREREIVYLRMDKALES
jgi:serine/threonine protein kinase